MGVVGESTGGGALKGAAAGASIGSVVPGIGTAIGAAAGAVVGGVVGYISGKNKKKRLDAAKKASERPTLEIPDSIKQNVAMYDLLANSSRMPGQSAIEDRISGSSASATNKIQQNFSDSSQALAGIAAVKQNENAQYANLGVQAANLQLQAKDKLADSRGVLADYEMAKFNYNKNQPYMMALDEKRRIEDQSKQDFQNSLQSFINGAGAYSQGGGGYQNGLMEKWTQGSGQRQGNLPPIQSKGYTNL